MEQTRRAARDTGDDSGVVVGDQPLKERTWTSNRKSITDRAPVRTLADLLEFPGLPGQ